MPVHSWAARAWGGPGAQCSGHRARLEGWLGLGHRVHLSCHAQLAGPGAQGSGLRARTQSYRKCTKRHLRWQEGLAITVGPGAGVIAAVRSPRDARSLAVAQDDPQAGRQAVDGNNSPPPPPPPHHCLNAALPADNAKTQLFRAKPAQFATPTPSPIVASPLLPFLPHRKNVPHTQELIVSPPKLPTIYHPRILQIASYRIM